MSGADRVEARWRQALAWRPGRELVDDARRTARRALGHGTWRGFPAGSFALAPLPADGEAEQILAAYEEYDRLNAEHFGGLCPPVKIVINPRLRSTGGRMEARQRVLELNGYRLAEYPETRIEVVFHEMIHLWLYTLGLPAGHTETFKAKMAERGHTSIRYGVPGDPKGPRHAYPGSDRRVVYRCPHCQHTYHRRRRYGQPMLCGRCLRQGHGEHRIILVGALDGQDPR